MIDWLDTLFAPTSFRDFLVQTSLVRPTAVHGSPERFAFLGQMRELTTPSAAFVAHAGNVRLKMTDRAGALVEVAAAGEQAGRIYRLGATAMLDRYERSSAAVRQLCQALETTAGMPPGTCSAIVHVSTPDSGLGLHFDMEDVLTIQLVGTKRWTYSTEPAVPHAPAPHTLGHAPAVILRRCAPDPDELDRGPSVDRLAEIDLAPGSVFFLPKGHWHRTQALSESISLSLGWSGARWIDRLLEVVRERLLVDPTWRAPALGAEAAAPAAVRALASDAVASLAASASNLPLLRRGEDLLASRRLRLNTLDDAARFLLSDFAPASDLAVMVVELRTPSGESTALSIEPTSVCIVEAATSSPTIQLQAEIADFEQLLNDPDKAAMLVMTGAVQCLPFDLDRLSAFARAFKVFSGAA
jgi:hypothetical protein